MSYEPATTAMPANALAIEARGLSKRYVLYDRPLDRLKELLLPGAVRGREFWAMRNVGFELPRGEVLGILGRNGAGKSTLLQLLCGTLTPTTGQVTVNGRIAALLELGAGFNPEFSGRENVFLNAALLGLTPHQTRERFDDIVDFSGIGDFIDQPVKTYSSGMYVRLAFSVAISVDPDILVVDEALSVGDGEFARKSFDRIMALKDAGKTILFCSHSMYQIEAICTRALWLERGEIRALGMPADVVADYGAFIDRQAAVEAQTADTSRQARLTVPGQARIADIVTRIDGVVDAVAESGRSTLSVTVSFLAPEINATPAVALAFYSLDGKCLASVSSHNDGFTLEKDDTGRGSVELVFDRLPFLKGHYTYDVWLLCDRGLFGHDHVRHAGTVEVVQSGLEQGVVALPHTWRINAT